MRLYGPERSFHRKIGDIIHTISLRIPLSAAYAEGYRTTVRLSILLAVVPALLFGVQFFLYRRFLISPLGVIRDKALAIAGSKEQLGEKIPVSAGREFKELADAFNEMSQKLRISMDRLEDRVVERTLELNASNAELKREITEREQAEEKIQASLREKEVLITVIIRKYDNKEIEIVVCDNGLGLPDDVDIGQPRSMGLHLVNGLVKNQLDGQIEVRRDNGTEFRIIFPL